MSFKTKALSVKKPSTVQNKNTWARALKRNLWLYLMLIPGFTLLILFAYKPMVGIVMAFQDFKFKQGFWGSEWVGFYHFKRFFEYKHFWRLIRNTILLNVYCVASSMPACLIFAFMVNELKNGIFRKSITTISYIPNFISSVIIASIFTSLLMPSGIINSVLTALGLEKINFLEAPEWFRTIYVFLNLWSGTGWGSIVYVAALSGIDQELYEAAYIDGAGKLKQTWHISLPGIAPTICIMLIMKIGALLSSNADLVLLIYRTRTYETADVIGTYIYRMGLQSGEYSYSTAVGIFQSVIGMVLLTIANFCSKKFTESSLF